LGDGCCAVATEAPVKKSAKCDDEKKSSLVSGSPGRNAARRDGGHSLPQQSTSAQVTPQKQNRAMLHDELFARRVSVTIAAHPLFTLLGN
jgi:hypothetical protein